MDMQTEKWNEVQIMEKIFEVFPTMGGKLILDPERIDNLLTDPRCPAPKQSNLVEWLSKKAKNRLNSSEQCHKMS